MTSFEVRFKYFCYEEHIDAFWQIVQPSCDGYFIAVRFKACFWGHYQQSQPRFIPLSFKIWFDSDKSYLGMLSYRRRHYLSCLVSRGLHLPYNSTIQVRIPVFLKHFWGKNENEARICQLKSLFRGNNWHWHSSSD